MINLQKISGLPILLHEKGLELEFCGDFQNIEKSERTLDELRPYLKNPDIKKRLPAGRQGPDPIYKVWRYTHLKKDDEKLKTANLRYDLTLMPAGTIDEEFVKTAGHYHKPYPEVYEVLVGRAYFLIQSESAMPTGRQAVYLAEAGPGEKFIIPPFFGHNTINIFNEPLLMANFVSEKAKYDYKPYENNRGAMYYFIKNNDLVDIVKNPNYESVPKIKKIRVKEYPEFGLTKNRPLYSLVNNLDKLRFLNYPEEFKLEI